jgi:hypothetical protein
LTATGSDILLVLSGGSVNTDPNLSLGGDPSSTSVLTGINNLFDDVDEDDASLGKVDYRCIYVVNDNATDPVYDVRIFVDSEVPDGSGVLLGISEYTDTQRLTVVGTATGGSFTISYEGNPVVVNWNVNPAVWGTNLQNGLNALADLSGVQVLVGVGTGSTTFTIKFMGDDDNRNHQLIALDSNSLTGSVTGIVISKIVEGGPINFIAPPIALPTTTPAGVTFTTSSEVAPISIGTLQPLDSFAVWVQRTTPSSANAVANDGFRFRLLAKPILT